MRGRVLPWGVRTYVMGIVNVTPDSFSGDGVADASGAAALAAAHAAAGADVIDVGAESTRPGFTPIGDELERARLLPALAAIRARVPDAVVSVDTFKAGRLPRRARRRRRPAQLDLGRARRLWSPPRAEPARRWW